MYDKKSISCYFRKYLEAEAHVLLRLSKLETLTEQKMKFSIKDVFSKCDQIRSFLWMWRHLLKKALMKNYIFVQCQEHIGSSATLRSYNFLWTYSPPQTFILEIFW